MLNELKRLALRVLYDFRPGAEMLAEAWPARRWGVANAAVALMLLVCGNTALTAAEPSFSREQLDFFEAKIRPVLVERCYSCHSASAGTTEAELQLDSRQAVLRGGDSGPAVDLSQPGSSLLLHAVGRESDDVSPMPPDDSDQLSMQQIADIRRWIEWGLPDPRGREAVPPARDWQTAAQHWAFQPLAPADIPADNDPVDFLVRRAMNEQGVTPNPSADARTWLRRVSYGLTGLPPTAEQVAEFLRDDGPQARAAAVDRLLDMPGYGEHWGRHWLDVARYADTRGYLAGGRQERFSFSHVYRDYVIEAFQHDKPYDQFVIEQLAADFLELGDDKSALAAMGFLTLGRRFNGNNELILDDRIDVVMRGLQALTVTCARCHDHKFDPIPTEDYYSLHGVFASSHEPGELPLLRPLDESSENYQGYLAERRKLEDKIQRQRDKRIDEFQKKHRPRLGDYLLAAHESAQLGKGDTLEEFAGKRDVDVRILRRWIERLKLAPEKRSEQANEILGPWLAVAGSAAEVNSADKAASADMSTAWQKRVDPTGKLASKELAGRYNELSRQAFAEPKEGTADEKPDALLVQLRQHLTGDDCPSNPSRKEIGQWLSRIVSNDTAGLRRDIEALNWKHDGAPARAPVLVDRSKPADSRVYKRGNKRNRGARVPRQFVRLLAGEQRQPFQQGSGRLELARAIVAADNPLTARVFVNRVWAWHFGTPLVETPSDFGLRTQRPTQLALLDWLAADFMRHGWSIKHLHRRILLSATYAQSSQPQAKNQQLDPRNLYWHHVPRRRLQFEEMRDSMLLVAGRLDRKRGGISVDVTQRVSPPRRTVYAYVDRQNLPGLLRTFDYPTPDTTSPGRFGTTVPQQALFLLNSHFAVQQAKALAVRVNDDGGSREMRLQRLYQLVLQRSVRPAERELGLRFLSDYGQVRTEADRLGAWQVLAQTLLVSNEMMFVD